MINTSFLDIKTIIYFINIQIFLKSTTFPPVLIIKIALLDIVARKINQMSKFQYNFGH